MNPEDISENFGESHHCKNLKKTLTSCKDLCTMLDIDSQEPASLVLKNKMIYRGIYYA